VNDKTEILADMKLVYVPYGYSLLINGGVPYADGIAFGLETVLPDELFSASGLPSPYTMMTNPQLQALVVPRLLGHCKTDVRVPAKVNIPTSFGDQKDMKKLFYNLCNGDLSCYTCADDVLLFKTATVT
jgi:hypothetical protein